MTTDPDTADDDTPADTGAEAATPAKGKKSTNAVIAQRIEDVLRLRIDGATFADIRTYANQPEQDWQVSDSQLKRYIVKSDELLKERTEKSRGKATRLHLARREGLFARAVSAGDLRTALAALDSTAKLQGLFEDPSVLRELKAEFREIRALVESPPAALPPPPADPEAGQSPTFPPAGPAQNERNTHNSGPHPEAV